ncbi:MAG: hypothetical protein KAV87_19710 [Desulfobacteraceae bacterium]|nr:hypothetical protein [Desulfobacteraceae bacterium]
MTFSATYGLKMTTIREIIIDALLIGMSSALLWHFSNIWRYEKHFIAEPNIWIRSIETVGLLIILIFGIAKYIRDLHSSVSSRRKKETERDE